jgi:hypothetical protein
MSKYRELRLNQPKLTIKEGAREVIFKTISCMCDNVHYLTFKKNDDGDFKMMVMVLLWVIFNSNMLNMKLNGKQMKICGVEL